MLDSTLEAIGFSNGGALPALYPAQGPGLLWLWPLRGRAAQQFERGFGAGLRPLRLSPLLRARGRGHRGAPVAGPGDPL